ncbi:MAG: hypothetical protein SFW62_02885 [Alphaproteobacteria bacterium]|nr:hypothetical protein [Alphaproteobacteria bacterium]
MSAFLSGAIGMGGSNLSISDAVPSAKVDREGRRFLAIDLENTMLRPEQLEQLADLYAEVFNEVEMIEPKWTPDTARGLLKERLARPGSRLALVDTAQKNRIVGGFFARIAPGPEGFNLTEPDVFISREYRGMRLGTEIGYVGRAYADEVSEGRFGEHIVRNLSQTYKAPDFPKSMWERHGYTLERLYVQAAREILDNKRPPASDVKIRIAEEADIDRLVHFMADSATQTSSGIGWNEHRAQAFLQYICAYNCRAITRIAEAGSRIVGFMAGDTIQRRSGSSLVNVHAFLSINTADGMQTMQALAHHTVEAANTVSVSQSNRPVTEIEISEDAAIFFGSVFPSLREDNSFLNMAGDHNTITRNLHPHGERKIHVVPS